MLEALIDYLGFTVKEYEGKTATPSSVVADILNLDINQFQLTRGGHGYRSQYLYSNMHVYFDGKDDMGVHVEITGEGVRQMEAAKGFKWDNFFYLLINWFKGKVTRLDIAVDDKEKILDLDLLHEKMKSGEIVARWRYARFISNHYLKNGECTGRTLYCGRRSSDIMCRFYDKREQMRKRYEAEGKELPEHWIRCELELKKEKANNFAVIYYESINKKPFGMLFSEALNNYMRVTDRSNDSNRSRWNNCDMWERFNQAVGKLKLTSKEVAKKLEDVYAWVKKSVTPSLWMLFKAAGGDLDFFMDLVKEGAKRISKRHLLMLGEYERELRESTV